MHPVQQRNRGAQEADEPAQRGFKWPPRRDGCLKRIRILGSKERSQQSHISARLTTNNHSLLMLRRAEPPGNPTQVPSIEALLDTNQQRQAGHEEIRKDTWR